MSSALNLRIAERLAEAAALLEQQGASPFRAGAYRRAAGVVADLEEDAGAILKRAGPEGLMALPGIGPSIAAAMNEMACSGRWSLLERLRGASEPEALLCTVPGIGPELARRVHEELDVDTLEALETAAHDGRLAAIPGFGPRRIAALRASLQAILGRIGARRPCAEGPTRAEVPVALLLDVDRQYREQAEAGRLPTIAPRRFNPEGKAWLPILHGERQGWHVTALFSNTARAHELGRTRDWVVIYVYDGDHRESQHTVVTESRGPLSGRRVVRGREAECREHYAQREAGAAVAVLV